MNIDSFSGTPVSRFSRNPGDVNRPNAARPGNARVVNRNDAAATTEPSPSVAVSIASDRSRANAGGHAVVFAVDPKSQDIVVKVLNKETGKEIRQIPTEDFQRLSQRIDEFQSKFLDLG